MTTSVKKKRKLFQVAKELNLSSQTIREFLEKKGHSVRNPNMVITDDIYEEILNRFSHEKKAAEKIQKRRLERIKEEQAAEETSEAKVAGKEGEPAKEESAEIAAATPEAPVTAETLEEISDKAAEVVTSSAGEVHEAEAAKPAVETAPPDVPEPVATTPSEETEEATPAEAEETAEEAASPDIQQQEEEAKPRVGDIIPDHPMAKKFLEEKRKLEQQKKERQRRTLKRLKEDRKTAQEEVSGQEQLPEDTEIGAATAETAGVDLAGKQADSEVTERRKRKKDKKRKTLKEEEEEKEARRRKAYEMLRRESKKLKPHLAVVEEEDAEAVLKEKEGKRKRSKKKEVDAKEVDDAVKKTLAEMKDVGAAKKKRKKVRKTDEGVEEEEKVIRLTEFISTQELANLMDVAPQEIIKKCLELGMVVSINQRLDMDIIKLVAEEFGFKVVEEEEYPEDLWEEIEAEEDRPEDLVPRPPVVTVMGHVDHGKTSLLDYVRSTNVVAGESGGITQHIGAYEVELDSNKKITFLDTPGHEAFTAMRARGAQVTDIVVLVVAADDQVRPQTIEAIDHAQAAGVPIIIAITKVDKPNANPEAIRKQLAERNILVEDWGGSYQVAEVSSKTGKGIPELLEKILLEAELLELKANPNRRHAQGVVLESRLDKGKGPVATVLIQNGTLKIGDYFVVGQNWGRVRALLNERDQRVDSAGPSTPVQVLGIDGVPEAGDKFFVVPDEKTAREISGKRRQLKREQDFRQVRLLSLDEISRRIKEGVAKELNVLVKADVDGSAQALADSLLQLSTDEVRIEIVRRAVGPISESDVMLAAASGAIIIGFNVRPTLKAKELAEKEHVDIRLYKVIYDAIDDVKKALEGMLEPIEREEVIGTAEVREVFKISRMGNIAGCYVLSGKIHRNANVRVIRNDVEIYDGKLSSLKRFKEDAKEVTAGYECGLMIENFNDIKVGDIIEAYEIVKEAQTLDKKTT